MRRHRLALICLALVAGLVAAVTISRWLGSEPMIGQLPARYETEPFDIWREEGGADFRMCMRVALSPEEVAAFIPKFFDRTSVGVMVDTAKVQTWCDAPFWPSRFETKTIAFEADAPSTPDRLSMSGKGAVYERGQLHFWSYAL